MGNWNSNWATFAAIAAATAAPAMAQEAPDLAGDWSGAIATPQGDLTLILHVKRGDGGALSAEVESWDLAPGRMATVTDLSTADGKLSFRVPSVGASYQGEWDAAAHKWKGTFSQGGTIALDFTQGAPAPKPLIEGLDGTWIGSVQRNGATLRQILQVASGAWGTNATYSSPDQLANGWPVGGLTREGQTVRFSVARGVTKFEGALSADGSQIAGKWVTPNQPDMDMTLTRATPEAIAARQQRTHPQTPQAPFPYKTEEVTFDNPHFAEVHLGGTLSLPEGAGPFPAAVLITGSGAQDRDESLLGHKPFAVIADYLTRHGIAVLRFDDRGVGKSTGDYGAATSADLATDANAAFAYLRTRPEIRHDAIGFIGHSEGGMIGPIAMAGNPDVAYLVMLAGPGTGLEQLMLSQRRLIGTQMGQSQAELDKAEPVLASVFHAIAAADTPQAGYDAAIAVMTPEAKTAVGMPAEMDGAVLVKQVSGPWFQYFLKYDPAPNLARIKVPLLALNGSLDRQVPPEANLAAIREATKGNPDVTAIELPGLNHLFQPATNGGVGEYADIETTIAPIVLETMTNWITQRFVKP